MGQSILAKVFSFRSIICTLGILKKFNNNKKKYISVYGVEKGPSSVSDSSSEKSRIEGSRPAASSFALSLALAL